MPRKLTLDEVKEKLINIHPTIRIIDNKYLGTDEPILCKCTIDGYEWTSSWSDLRRNVRLCPVCNITTNLNIDIVKLKLKNINPNIKIIDDVYVDSDTKLKCKCLIDGMEWGATWGNLKSGSGCPKCKGRFISDMKTYTIDEIKQKLKIVNKDIEILSKERSGNQKITCRCLTCNNVWDATWGNLQAGRGCPVCGAKRAADSQRLTLEEIKKQLKTINPDVIIISDEYTNCKEKITCRCLICGNEWGATWDNISAGKGCPQCLESRGERRVRQYLQSKDILFVQEYSFYDLLGLGGQLLRFDFAIFNPKQILLCLIEYDGEFHYKKYYKNQNFEEIQIHDKLKDFYCRDRNIKLIRIPYWKYDEIENILDDSLMGGVFNNYRNKI